MSSGASYYDIDDILAQEELTPVTTLLDFTYLAHLDPDYVHGKSHDNDVKHNAQGESQQQENTSRSPVKKPQNHYLKEGTRFKMPLWSIEKWAQVGFVKMSFPRHYGKKARERLDADPVSVDIRKRNERFYLSGIHFLNLIQKCHSTNQQFPKTHPNLLPESQLLKQTLLQTYTGARMRRIFDWTLSRIEDDVSEFTEGMGLTEMEMGLFERGKEASRALYAWKLFGTRRIVMSDSALVMRNVGAGKGRNSVVGSDKTPGVKRSKSKTVSPEGVDLGVTRKKSRAY